MTTPPPSPFPTLLRYVLSSSSIPSTLPLHLVPNDSQASITQFYRLSDKKLALGSQLLQRMLLCETHHSLNPNVTLQSVTLWKDPKSGRPGYVLPEGTTEARIIDYNVSHHSGLIVLAALLPSSSPPPPNFTSPTASKSRRIGVDVVTTSLSPRSSSPQDFLISFTSPSAGIFTPHEITTIYSPPTWPLRIKLFYMHWALKEAYVKATGTGLVTDLTQIEFRDVKLFEGTRYTGARLYLGIVEKPDWYLEVEVFQGGEEGECFIAVAAEREGLSEGDLRSEWKAVDWERDIVRWDEARIER